jgi:hypothetical protein
MPMINVTFDEPAWPDLEDKDVIHITGPICITGLTKGMRSGKTSVAIRIDIPPHFTEVVLVETSLELFLTTADMLKVKYGDPRISIENKGE